MKIKAIILACIFILGGSGLSIDIAQCCSQFAGIGLSFNAHQHEEDKDCCACFKSVKKKSCCEDVVIQTVINPVLGLGKLIKKIDRQFYFKVLSPTYQTISLNTTKSQTIAFNDEISHHDPVPILIKKRLLRI